MTLKEANPKDSRLQTVYKVLHNARGSVADTEVENKPYTRAKDGISYDSFQFKRAAGESVQSCLQRIFGAIDFPAKHDSRILTLHSSALAALLCFGNISKANPLVFPGLEDCSFTECEFEHSNPVLLGGPSRVDVVLTDRENKVKLYMEAKFSEYVLHCGRCVVSQAYREKYQEFSGEHLMPESLRFANLGEDCKVDPVIEPIKKQVGKHCYCEGIKQMLSHLIGIENVSVHFSNPLIFKGASRDFV